MINVSGVLIEIVLHVISGELVVGELVIGEPIVSRPVGRRCRQVHGRGPGAEVHGLQFAGQGVQGAGGATAKLMARVPLTVRAPPRPCSCGSARPGDDPRPQRAHAWRRGGRAYRFRWNGISVRRPASGVPVGAIDRRAIDCRASGTSSAVVPIAAEQVDTAANGHAGRVGIALSLALIGIVASTGLGTVVPRRIDVDGSGGRRHRYLAPAPATTPWPMSTPSPRACGA